MALYVTGFCRINQEKVIVNDEVITHKPNDSIVDFLVDFTKLGENYPKIYKMDQMSRFGVIASELIFNERNPSAHYKEEEIAVVLSNHSSSLDTDLKYQKSTDTIPSPALFVYTLPNIVTGEICIRNKFKGENAFFGFSPALSAPFSSFFDGSRSPAILRCLSFWSRPTKACLAGWIEVLGDNHDVFLYLVEEKKPAYCFNHSAEELLSIYTKY